MDSLAGRTAFITGGAQGIGLGIAQALAAEGVRVALADLNARALAAATAALSPLTEVRGYQLDVRDRDRFAVVADAAEDDLGPVTLVFNNAGVASKMSVTELSYETWDWSLGINLGGVVNGVQTWVPRLLARRDGHIVNTASAAGLIARGRATGFLYPTAKFAVVGLSEGLREQLAPSGIGVTVLCPGNVATGLYDNTAAAFAEAGDWSRHLGRLREALRAGTPVADVGRRVIDAIRDNAPYVLTDRTLATALPARTADILAAMPAAGQLD